MVENLLAIVHNVSPAFTTYVWRTSSFARTGAGVAAAAAYAALRPCRRGARLSSSWLPASRPRRDWFIGITSTLPTFT